MLQAYKDILDKKFTIRENEGEDKVCDLKEAVRKHIEPGMMLHFALTSSRAPSAIIYEIARQFWGKKPDFILATNPANFPATIWTHGDLVKKIICSSLADPYYTIRPVRVYQRAYLEKKLEIESWSMFAIAQRLRAGAFGMPFMPVKSLIGSNMEKDNQNDLRIIEDPFGSGQKICLVKALRPDLALVHAVAADRYGNAIFTTPFGDSLYGALGAKKGVLLTTEKIVSTDYIRKHSHLVRLPGYMVRSVSEAPFGAHPAGFYNQGLIEFEPYQEDYEFFYQLSRIGKDPQQFQAWIDEWVLNIKDHWEYLKKLGSEKILYLKGRANKDSWRYQLESMSEGLDASEKYNAIEMAITVASRKIKEKAREKGYRTLLGGAGTSFMAMCMAFYALREEGYDIEPMVETGMFGISPRPAEPYLVSYINLPTCKSLTDMEQILGVHVGGEDNKCFAALGAAEIDKHGNINSTLGPGDIYLIGSGGANDICSTAQEVIVIAIQARERFLDKVSYITSIGKRVRTLVSTLGVFEKLGNDDEFTLTSYYPNPEFSTPEQNIANVKSNCGWDLKITPRVAEIPKPTMDELMTLRLLDPQRYFLGKAA